MTREARLIGSHLKMASDHLLNVKTLTPSARAAPTLMFYAAENLLMAVFTSEGLDAGAARRKHGNHQLDRMLDELPKECAVVALFEPVIELVAYATTYRYPSPTGKIPAPPSEATAQGYFEALVSLLDACAKHFQVNVRLDEPEAGSVKPFR